VYIPKFFKEKDFSKAIGLVKKNPLGTLIIGVDSGFEVNHIPFVVDCIDSETPRLRAHIPRANSLSTLLANEQKCVVTFDDANGYISPSWYATKKQHGKVVPTWNYSVVHVHGTIIVKDDGVWVMEQLKALTELNEIKRTQTWAISDAPAEFINQQLKALVGLEVIATKVEAKTKASQNQPTANQASILFALESEQPDSALHALMKSVLGDKRS